MSATSKLIVDTWTYRLRNKYLLFYLHELTLDDGYNGYYSVLCYIVDNMRREFIGIPSHVLESNTDLKLSMDDSTGKLEVSDVFAHIEFRREEISMLKLDYRLVMIHANGHADAAVFIGDNVIYRYLYSDGVESYDELMDVMKTMTKRDVISDLIKSVVSPFNMLLELIGLYYRKRLNPISIGYSGYVL